VDIGQVSSGWLHNLSPVLISLNAANKSPIKIDGVFFAKLAGQSTAGKVITCQTMIYVIIFIIRHNVGSWNPL